ncbi:hypothetical protein EDC04DRAFT_2090068 [Pisolithus marmoratus]|nr:hypothetical protein EDC04DRAFT_2090068 [Pisolithus marmoratus]
MHLSFTKDDHLNTSINDEDGRQLYSVSTPGFCESKTIITKHGSHGGDVIGVITWHTFRSTKIWLRATGVEVPAKSLLKSKWCSSTRTFIGPDGEAYGWSKNTNCTLKAEGSDLQLAKYHQRNFGIRKPSHAPYLEVSPSISHMLDYILIIFVYAEKLSQEVKSAGMDAATNAVCSVICTMT